MCVAYVCTHVYTCFCYDFVCMCVHVFMCVCIYVCLHVCTCVCVVWWTSPLSLGLSLFL